MKSALLTLFFALITFTAANARAETIIPDAVVRKNPVVMRNCRKILNAEEVLQNSPPSEALDSLRESISPLEDLIPTCKRLLHRPVAHHPSPSRTCQPGQTRWVESCNDCTENEVCGPAGDRRYLDWYCGCLSH